MSDKTYEITCGHSSRIEFDNEWSIWGNKEQGVVANISTEEADQIFGGRVGEAWDVGDPVVWDNRLFRWVKS